MITAARPYARAAFAAAQETGSLDNWMAFLQGTALCMGEARLIAYLASPSVARATKQTTLLRLLTSSGIQSTKAQQNFLTLLLANNRLSILTTVADLFKRMKLESENKIIALVRTAFALTDQERTDLEQRLSKFQKQPVLTDMRLDESLMGGLVIEMQGHSWDYSIRGKLNQLRNDL